MEVREESVKWNGGILANHWDMAEQHVGCRGNFCTNLTTFIDQPEDHGIDCELPTLYQSSRPEQCIFQSCTSTIYQGLAQHLMETHRLSQRAADLLLCAKDEDVWTRYGAGCRRGDECRSGSPLSSKVKCAFLDCNSEFKRSSKWGPKQHMKERHRLSYEDADVVIASKERKRETMECTMAQQRRP